MDMGAIRLLQTAFVEHWMNLTFRIANRTDKQAVVRFSGCLEGCE